MAEKAKFDRESVLKSILGPDRELEMGGQKKTVMKEKNKDRVQRSYFLDRDIDKALRRKAVEEEKTLTEVINEILKIGLSDYMEIEVYKKDRPCNK